MARAKRFGRRLPLLVEKGDDGFYVVECPVLEGCYTQGKTMDEALRNIRDVIALILEEKESQEVLKRYNPEERAGPHAVASLPAQGWPQGGRPLQGS